MATAGKWNLPGSDINLPDFGFSEKLGINKPTNLGGNYSVGNNGAVYLNKGDAGAYVKPGSTLGTSDYRPATNTQTNTRPNDKSIAPVANKDPKPNKDGMDRANKDKAAAELKSLNTQYDRTKADLQSQLGYLGSQREQGMKALQNALTGFQTQVGKARTGANEETDRAINEAASTTQETVRSNRNTLRGLGILSSSAAGDILSRPVQAFDVERANLKRQLVSRLSELDDFLNQKSSEHALAVQSLEDNYANLVNKIQRDLRFNDRERADAVREARAALQYNMQQLALQQQQNEMVYNQQLSGLSDAATLIDAQDFNANYDPNAIAGQGVYGEEQESGDQAAIYGGYPMDDETYQSTLLENQAPLVNFRAPLGQPVVQNPIAANLNRIRLSDISRP